MQWPCIPILTFLCMFSELLDFGAARFSVFPVVDEKMGVRVVACISRFGLWPFQGDTCWCVLPCCVSIVLIVQVSMIEMI